MGNLRKTAKKAAKKAATLVRKAAKKVAKRAAAPQVGKQGVSARASIHKLKARWPALSPIERAAFGQLVSEVQADALGKQTKSEAVHDDALRWAVKMDDALRDYPGALSMYSPRRFAWYLECLERLHEEIATERGRRAKVDAARSAVGSARDEALKTRKRLEARLHTIAGAREAEREELSAAMGTTDTDDHLAESLRALSKLGHTWLGRADEESKVLCESAGLSQAEIDEALRCAKALSSSASEAQLEGNAHPKDSAAVNRVEGRMLWEMREARRIFNDAHEENGVISKLEPSASTRHVLGTRKRNGHREEEPETEETSEASAKEE